LRPLVAALLLAGCIRAPDIVVLDRASVLEREAQGRFPELELELEKAGTAARPAPVTREQLEAVGRARSVIEELTPTEAERIDALLVDRCIGEALDGTLVERRETCAMKEVPRLPALLERTNRQRAQVWEWLRAARPARSPEEVRRAWRDVHLTGLPCGAEVQRADGGWEPKRC
jgi:hypothetical protein